MQYPQMKLSIVQQNGLAVLRGRRAGDSQAPCSENGAMQAADCRNYQKTEQLNRSLNPCACCEVTGRPSRQRPAGDDFVDFLHDPDGIVEGDNDLLVVVDVVGGESSALAVF